MQLRIHKCLHRARYWGLLLHVSLNFKRHEPHHVRCSGTTRQRMLPGQPSACAVKPSINCLGARCISKNISHHNLIKQQPDAQMPL